MDSLNRLNLDSLSDSFQESVGELSIVSSSQRLRGSTLLSVRQSKTLPLLSASFATARQAFSTPKAVKASHDLLPTAQNSRLGKTDRRARPPEMRRIPRNLFLDQVQKPK